MTIVNDTTLPTCAELASVLAKCGDKPLYSGNGWVAVVGFKWNENGVQVEVKSCPPSGVDVYEKR